MATTLYDFLLGDKNLGPIFTGRFPVDEQAVRVPPESCEKYEDKGAGFGSVASMKWDVFADLNGDRALLPFTVLVDRSVEFMVQDAPAKS